MRFINRGEMIAVLYAGLTYEDVVRKYAQTVAGVCVMRLQNHADAEDCFQNTFVKLLTKSPSINDENHLKYWLIQVAIHECYSFLRKNRREISLCELPNEPSFKSEDEMDVSWALMKVKQDYREILYLHYCEGYKVKEIADILGRNPNTVKVMLKRGREMLKSIYGGETE